MLSFALYILLNSSTISYNIAFFSLKKKKKQETMTIPAIIVLVPSGNQIRICI